MTIINDDSRVVNKLEASLTDVSRVIIYDCRMFIVQATAYYAEQYKDYQRQPKKTPNVVKAILDFNFINKFKMLLLYVLGKAGPNSEKLSYHGQT